VFADPAIPKLIPRMSIWNTFQGTAPTWAGAVIERNSTRHEFSAKVAHQRGSHYLKTGVDIRRNTTTVCSCWSIRLRIDAQPTASTYINPNLLLSATPYATFFWSHCPTKSRSGVRMGTTG